MASESDGEIMKMVEYKALTVVILLLLCLLCSGQNVHNPRFLNEPMTVRVSELTPVHDDVFTCQATDDDISSGAADLQFSIVGGNGASSFSINSNSCDVTVVKPLDFETASEYDVIIQVSDQYAGNPKTATATVTVEIIDANEQPVLHDWPTSSLQVSEDTSLTSQLFLVSASDQDSSSSPSGQLTYTITAGNTDGVFDLDPSTGVLKLQKPLDFESDQQHVLTVRVADLDPNNPQHVVGALTIDVTDANDSPVLHQWPTSPLQVSEDTSLNAQLFLVSASDQDSSVSPSGQLTFTIAAGNTDGVFDLDSSTGVLKLQKSLNYESRQQHVLTVRVSDLDPINPQHVEGTLTVDVTDVNEFTPSFINVPAMPIQLKEDSGIGTTVITCSVSDGDSSNSPSGRHRFSIVAGNEDDMFSLDKDTCHLTLTKTLNFERQSEYSMKIEASDLHPTSPRSVSLTFTFQVEDVNERPTFKNLPGDPVPVSEDVSNGTVIFTCSAKDPDLSTLPRGQLTFAIIEGNEAGAFSVDDSTCAVSVSGPLDFETVEQYQLTLRARDQDAEGRLSVARPLVISVLDVNEHTPTFINVQSPAAVIGEHSRMGSAAFTCTALDQDSSSQPSGQLRYEITGGNEDGKFTLQDDAVCHVVLAQPLDFETHSLYSLTLTVRDLGTDVTFNSTQVFQITVVDENDRPKLQNTPKMPTVVENSPAGTLLFECTATDQDDPSLLAGRRSYSIVSGGADAFTLIPPCRIETARPLDHENQVFYDLEIEVTDLDPADPQTDTKTYTVKVSDVNDNTPYFVNVPAMPVLIPEDTPVGVSFANCSGDDDDTPLELSGHVRFEIIDGNAEKFFMVNETTCDLSLLKQMDYESTTLTFNLTVRIYDLDPTAPRSVEQEYRFCVANVNDNVPTWVEKLPKIVKIKENSPLGVYLGSCSATDNDTSTHPSGHVRYKITGGNAFALFYLNPYTCDMYVNGLLDYEQKKAHTLKVVAVDLDPDNPLQSTMSKMKVKIIDENDMGPTCQTNVMTMELSEATAFRSVVMTMNCSDVDQGSNGALRFKALTKSKTLAVDKMKGEIKLLKRQDWDDVSRSREHELLVQVQDKGDPPNSASATVRIIITDADDNKPVFNQSSYETYISETVPRGSTVLRVWASDGDGPDSPASTVTYGLQSVPDPDWFFVNPYTGDVVVKHVLDADTVAKVSFKVSAYSSNLTGKVSKATVVIYLTDSNDNTPVFTESVYQVSVAEANRYSQPVLTVSAVDLDTGKDGVVRYSIEDADAPLRIDRITGEVRVIGTLDFEDQRFFYVIVTAQDLGTPALTATATIVLTVEDTKNEFGPTWSSVTNFSVSEDTAPGSVVFQLIATDDDTGWDGEVEYGSSLSPKLPFLVDQSGRVILAAPLDYDTVNTYNIPVTVSDRSQQLKSVRSATATLHVTVVDVNDLPPVCRPVPVAVVVYPWTGIPVASVDCSPDADADTVNGQLSYRLVGGDDEGCFLVNATTGEVRTTAKPNQELYQLSVEVSDGGTPAMTSLVSVVILVEPELTLSNLPAVIEVGEDAAVGTVVFTALACCSFTALQFEVLSGNDDNHFQLHAVSGDVTLVKQLDRETRSQHVLVVGVGDERGQTSTATLYLNVTDVNDNAPTFNPVFTSLKVGELLSVGSPLDQWVAVDLDHGDNAALTYTLLDTAQGWFSVDDKGTLTLERSLDFETDRSFTLLLTAVDGGTPSLSATVTIQVDVVNADEYPPQFLNGSGSLSVNEDAPLGVVLFRLEARDADLSDVISYTLTDVDSPFMVFPDSGQVVLCSPLDRESVDVYDLSFVATSGQGETATLAVQVQVEDTNDNDPVFSSTVYEFEVPHGTAADVVVGQVAVTDDDIGDNADVNVSLMSGNGAGYFTMEGFVVKTAKTVSYDGVKEFVLTLKAYNPKGVSDDYRYSQAAVRIRILPATSIPKLENNTMTVAVEENVALNTVICDLDATLLGATEGGNGTLRYIIRTGNPQGFFSIREDSGILYVAGNVDYEAHSQYTLAVDAQNRNDATVKDSVIIIVNVINVNDNAPRPAAAVNQFSVNEDAAVNTLVGRVSFTDDDVGVFGTFTLSMTGCPQFRIDPSTGEVSVGGTLNFSDDSTYTCFVTASDAGSPSRSGMMSVVITVRDVNDHHPFFEGAPYSLNVYENTSPGATLATFRAVDLDEGEKGKIIFSLLSGDPSNVFFLNETTGELRLNAALDATLTSQFALELQAADGGNPPLTSQTDVTVNVIDINDHSPTFSVASLEVAADRVSPRHTLLATLNATDDDLDRNALITYTITAGNAEGLLTLDSSSGQLRTQGSLMEVENTLTLTVAATDHGTPSRSASISVTIFVNPPLSPSLSDPNVHELTVTVAEDVTPGTVLATIDPYPVLEATDYVIVSGNYGDSFNIVMQPDGTGQLVVSRALDFETYRTFHLQVNMDTEAAGWIQKLVKVDVTDVNDNVPQFQDSPSLELSVAENSPVGLSLWSLSVHDADHNDVSDAFLIQLESVTVDGLLDVTSQGDIVLLASPDYETQQEVEAVVTVKDSGTPQLSSSLSVTLYIIDIEERQLIQVPSAATLYISTEISYNAEEGQLVYRLSVNDFNLVTSSISTVTFLALDVTGAFAVSATAGEVTVQSPHQLEDNSVYFQWVVCKVSEADGSTKSEMLMLRVDTYDKYKNIVAVEIASDQDELETNRDVLGSKIQALFSNIRRAGIFTFIAHGDAARRRLLAAQSLALVYVVEDVAADDIHNIMNPKTFLTQEEILKVLQLSADGTPVKALTSDPLPAVLVMPYQTGSTDQTDITQSDYFPIILAIVCFLVVLVLTFIIACILYKAKRWRKWNCQDADGGKTAKYNIGTPVPAFFVRKDSVCSDDVSTGSTTSLLDDDSGMGDSVGSRSLARKSLTPSSESSLSDETDITTDEIALSAKSLIATGHNSVSAVMLAADGSSETSSGHHPQHSRYTWKKKKPTSAEDTWVSSDPKPPVSWLPPLPDDQLSAHRACNQSWFDSPYGSARYAQQGSGDQSGGYTASFAGGSGNGKGRSVDTSWLNDEAFSATSGKGRPEGLPQFGRRSSIVDSDRPPWLCPSLYPGFSSANSDGTTAPWLTSTEDSKDATPGHQVNWRPKRNPPKKIFHEKLEWNAVSTIPKASPLPRRRREVLANDPIDTSWTKIFSTRNKPSAPAKSISMTLGNPKDALSETAEKKAEDLMREQRVMDLIFGGAATKRQSAYNAPSFAPNIFE